jgi:hypothetical protein
MDQAINSSRAIERVQGAPPIAEIPRIETVQDRKHERNIRLWGLLIAPLVLIVLLALVHFLWMNLDILWYVGLRKFGM